jgi:hypothetical protein
MRTHILIAAALALSATTVHAAPRSLSVPQSNPVQPAPEAAKPADAPVFKVQSNEEAKPNALPQPAAPQPALPAPAQAAPAAAPADAGPARSAETKPAETQAAPAARPVRQAQRKQRPRQMTVEQRVDRELRSIERSISAMGAASAISSIGYAIPLVLYW